MKKIIFTLLALVGTMSMNAQIVKLYKGDVLVAKYKASVVDNVVFEEETAITGKATATIGGSQVEVNWVQLWEDGPKFAEYNVEGTMTFTDAVKTGDEYVWGANWRTPSKDELNQLMLAAQRNSESKVTCEYTQEGGTYGFKFTGKEEGYTGNSVFFPAQHVDSHRVDAFYWSATANGSEAWFMLLNCGDDIWGLYDQNGDYLVRPVLVEE